RAVLAQRPDHDDAVAAGADLALDLRRGGLVIDAFVLVELRRDRRENTGPARHGPLPFGRAHAVRTAARNRMAATCACRLETVKIVAPQYRGEAHAGRA